MLNAACNCDRYESRWDPIARLRLCACYRNRCKCVPNCYFSLSLAASSPKMALLTNTTTADSCRGFLLLIVSLVTFMGFFATRVTFFFAPITYSLFLFLLFIFVLIVFLFVCLFCVQICMRCLYFHTCSSL